MKNSIYNFTAGERREGQMIVLMIMAALLLAVTGCGNANTSEIRHDVLAVDPGFAAVLKEKNDIDAQLDTLKKELAQQQKKTARTIRKTRQDYKMYEKEIKQTIKQLSTTFDHMAKEIYIKKQALDTMRRAKSKELAHIKDAADNMGQLERNQTMTAEQTAHWKHQLHEFENEQARLEREIIEIEEQGYILNKKYMLLR